MNDQLIVIRNAALMVALENPSRVDEVAAELAVLLGQPEEMAAEELAAATAWALDWAHSDLIAHGWAEDFDGAARLVQAAEKADRLTAKRKAEEAAAEAARAAENAAKDAAISARQQADANAHNARWAKMSDADKRHAHANTRSGLDGVV